MKKVLLLHALMGITVATFAQQVQTVEFSTGTSPIVNSAMLPEQKDIAPVQMEFIYDYRYVIDTTAMENPKSAVKDLCILQVGKDVAKFSSLHRMRIDSLLATASVEEISATPEKFSGGDPSALFKNFPQGKFTTIDKISTDWIRIEEDMEIPKWELTSETKEILGYSCRKAVATFKGRDWEAWYTDQIAVPVGPWKLDGLPGLVCEAYDTEKHYHYTLVGTSSNVARNLTIPDVRFNKATLAKYYKAKRSYIENPLAGLATSGVQITIIDQSTGKPMNEADLISPMQYSFIER